MVEVLALCQYNIQGEIVFQKLQNLQGHPTEYFGKISVRMEGSLKISKFFSQRRSRLFKLFRKTIKFP